MDKNKTFSEDDIIYLPPEEGQSAYSYRPFLVGTKKVIWSNGGYKIVCATCGGGGYTPYRYRTEAIKAAVIQSSHPCQCKGCNAK